MQVKIVHIERDFLIDELDHESWKKARGVLIENYWSGEKAPSERHAKVKLLWSDSALYVRFKANQIEPLVISRTPNLKGKTIGLWDRDVCEIFVAPNPKESDKYFEFEVSPNGEWIDLKIQLMPDKRKTDFDYISGMESAAKIESGKVWMAMKIEWKAFGKAPKATDIWKGNLFRCVGSGDTRGYLAWSPTKTEMPNFHIPEAFGEFQFVK
jgi:hypothetical protein